MYKYDELMEKIEVTDEMRSRILSNLQKETAKKPDNILPFPGNRCSTYAKIFAVIACSFILLLGIHAIPSLISHDFPEQGTNSDLSSNDLTRQEQDSDLSSNDLTGQEQDSDLTAALPPAELDSAEELSDAVGFETADVPSLAVQASQISYTAIDNLAQIDYQVSDDQRISFRKSPGSDDNSGDYTEYTVVKTITVSDYTVTIKGDNDTFRLAIWNHDGYAYSIWFSEAVTQAELENILEDACAAN